MKYGLGWKEWGHIAKLAAIFSLRVYNGHYMVSVMHTASHILKFNRQIVYLFYLQNSIRYSEVLSKMDINKYLIET